MERRGDEMQKIIIADSMHRNIHILRSDCVLKVSNYPFPRDSDIKNNSSRQKMRRMGRRNEIERKSAAHVI
jgi:hypothetical protein